MDKLTDGLLSFVYSFFNLFLAWTFIKSIGECWDIPFLKADVLTFQMYWGCTFALGMMLIPAMMIGANQFQESDKDKRAPTILMHIIASFIMLLFWVLQLVISTVLF